MKLSTRSRYAVRAMIELALLFKKNRRISLTDLSKELHISRKYLEQIFSMLNTAGLVRALRGAKGGYTLTRPPNEISLLEVVEATEGPILLVDCVGSDNICRWEDICVARQLWKDVNESIRNSLRNELLSELADKESDLDKIRCQNYEI